MPLTYPTKEVVLAGRYAGTHYYSFTSKTRTEIKKLFQRGIVTEATISLDKK